MDPITAYNKKKLRNMFNGARSRAFANGRAFTITPAHLVVPATCPAFGVPLIRADGRFTNSPSLDRLDNTKGYTPDNIRIISWRANTLKGDASRIESFQLAIYTNQLTGADIVGYSEYGWL